jgi:hypothetical protein
MNVVKFPYSASRRVYARRPRISKNGTPEERAAKAGAAEAGPTFGELTRKLRAYFEQELARGLTVYQALDDLEGSWERAEKARQSR